MSGTAAAVVNNLGQAEDHGPETASDGSPCCQYCSSKVGEQVCHMCRKSHLFRALSQSVKNAHTRYRAGALHTIATRCCSVWVVGAGGAGVREQSRRLLDHANLPRRHGPEHTRQMGSCTGCAHTQTMRTCTHTWCVCCDQGKTPAHKACSGGHSACVKVLAEHKADLNTPDEDVPRAPLLRVCCVFCARASMMRVV